MAVFGRRRRMGIPAFPAAPVKRDMENLARFKPNPLIPWGVQLEEPLLDINLGYAKVGHFCRKHTMAAKAISGTSKDGSSGTVPPIYARSALAES